MFVRGDLYDFYLKVPTFYGYPYII